MIVSRSVGAAKATTRSIIDAYAPRVGNDTWIAHISEVGINLLRSELLQSASRRTAVACHKLDRGAIRLSWIVGDRALFSATGAIPTRVSQHGHKALSQRNCFPYLERLLPILGLASIAHDLGKNNTVFAKKLNDQSRSTDPVRHEVFSTGFLQHYLDGSLWPGQVLDWRRFPLPRIAESWKDLVYWICYTHHRTPAANNGCPNTSVHVTEHSAFVPQHQTPTKEDPELDRQFEHLKAELAKFSGKPRFHEGLGYFLYGRLALMLADHYVSAELRLERSDGAKNCPVANTKNKKRAAQDLALHNREVARYSKKALINVVQLPFRLPTLADEDLGMIRKQSRGRFTWQNSAAKVMDQIPAGHGALILLMGETGQGKTKAAARMMTGVTSPRRLTVCLGLRTLTLQTGDAYRTQFNLPVTHCRAMIGSREVKQLHENGDEESFSDPELEPGAGICTPLSEILGFTAGRKSDFITTPVLIATVDYLAEAGNWSRSRHLLSTLRLLSADLVLDEIDDYSTDDLPALARVVFLAAAYGRRVLLSSATLSPEISQAFFDAYECGWQIRRSLGFTGFAYLVMAHNRVDPVIEKFSTDSRAAISRYSERIANALPDPPHRKLGLLVSGGTSDLAPIVQAIGRLHHSQKVQGSKYAYSFGLIRVSQTKYAADLYDRLTKCAELQVDVPTYFLLYHARIPLFIRSRIEKDLDELLTRKSSRIGKIEVAYDPVNTRLGQKLLEKKSTEVRIIVVATPVTELGRDHDYDWAIIEPSSTRSILQIVGRVQRHRETPVVEPNVLLLSHNWHGTLNRPGFQPAQHSPEWANVQNVHESLRSLQTHFTAQHLLNSEPKDSLTALERATVKERLNASIQRSFIERLETILTNEHPQKYPFRSVREEAQEAYYCMQRGQFFGLNRDTAPLKDPLLEPSFIEQLPWPDFALYTPDEFRLLWGAFAGDLSGSLEFTRRFFSTEIQSSPGKPWIGNLLLGTFSPML